MTNNLNLKARATKIVVATRNPGKLREFCALLAPAGWQVVGLTEAAIEGDIAETGSSFAANARLKAPWPCADPDASCEAPTNSPGIELRFMFGTAFRIGCCTIVVKIGTS